jgi:hypothetical protein
MLTRHCVRFRGPLLTRRTRDTFSTAGIALLERNPVADWNGQVIEYLVALPAKDGKDAIARVRRVVSLDGFYSEFSPDPP